jgi:branched-chain amino acid transport system substrate-binding protein
MDRYHIKWAIAALAAAATLTACSSSSTSSTGNVSAGSGGGSASSSAGPSGAPIKIGQIAPVNAPDFNTADSVAAVKAAFAQINKDGGVDGRPLQLDYCNEANDPNQATACARQMVNDGVVATISSNSITAGPTIVEILEKAGITNVNWLPNSPAESAATNVYPIAITQLEILESALVVVKAHSLTKVAYIGPNAATLSDVPSLMQTYLPRLNASFVKAVLLPRGAIADYSPYAKQIIDSGAQVVALGLTQQQSVGVITALRQLGSNIWIATNASSMGADAAIQDLGSATNNVSIINPTPWVHDVAAFPGLKPFIAGMNAEAASGDTAANLTTARPITVTDWGSAYAIADELGQMITAKTEINAKDFTAAWSKAKNLTTDGVMGTWSPADSLSVPALNGNAHLSFTSFYTFKPENGHIVLTSTQPQNLLSYVG